MKHMKSVWALLLCLTMVLSLAACGQGAENTAAPEISGVADQSVPVGTEFDAMAGVTATDAEDGDLTAQIVVTSLPELTFSNGKATPDAPGSYELTYTVTDKGGLEAKAYATLTVTRQTGEATVLQQMDFATPESQDSHGWTAHIAEGVDATGEQKEGAFVFTIADPGQGDGDIQLVKSGVTLKAADYRVKVWAKADTPTYAHLLARNENAEEWETFGGAYNLPIGTEIAPLELNFTSPGEGSAELMLNLGKITPNPDNPDDTTPANVTVTIDKIEFYEITGNETQTPHRRGRRRGDLPDRRLSQRGRRMEHQGRSGPARRHRGSWREVLLHHDRHRGQRPERRMPGGERGAGRRGTRQLQ